MRSPVLHYQLIVEPHPVSILPRESDEVVRAFARYNRSGPPDGIILRERVRHSVEAPREINFAICACERRRPFQLRVRKVLRLQAMFHLRAIGKERGTGNRVHYRPDQSRALDVDDFGVWEPLADPRQHSHGLRRRPVIVPFQGIQTVGIGADHGDRFVGVLKGQQAILILQQHDGFARRLQCKLAMRFGIVLGRRNFRVRHHRARIEHSQSETRG